MCNIDKRHKEHDAIERGHKVLHLMLNLDLYSAVKASLLWCKLFDLFLLKIGFKLNPCNLCAVNSVINNKQ